MLSIHIIAIFTILLFIICYRHFNFKATPAAFTKGAGNLYCLPAVLLGSALALRLLLSYFYHGFDTDISCFAAWADRIFRLGPSQFYSPDVFTDYPPGYMYILYGVEAVRSLLRIPYMSELHILLLKLPAILCDIVCGCLLYRTACKKTSDTTALLLTSIYLFNPAVILNSAVWGQIDSVFTLAVVLMCLGLVNCRMPQAYLAYALGVLLKPQMLVFTPVLLIGVFDHVFIKQFSLRKLMLNLMYGVYALLALLLLCLPFGLDRVFAQYIQTLGAYPYTAVNAYNFWGLLGLNWTGQDGILLFFSYRTWGAIAIFLIVLFTFLISFILKGDSTKYLLLGAFIILTMFVFSVRMHERYMYPGLILLLFAFLYKPVKSTFVCYTVFSVLHFYNTAHVMFFYDPQNYHRKAPVILLVSAGMVLCIIYFHSVIARCYQNKSITEKLSVSAVSYGLENDLQISGPATNQDLPPIRRSGEKISFSRLDLFLLLAITILYGCFALYDLGDTSAPQTAYHMRQGESIVLDFGENTAPARLSYYIAPSQKRRFSVEYSIGKKETWHYLNDIILDDVFTWENIPLENTSRYLRLTLLNNNASLLELTFSDAQGNILIPLNSDDYPALFDEVWLHPKRSTFRNGMYFDEIYHARTAYEYLHRLYSYENTHPPLGKILISVGIRLFGMTPFGWRIIGTLFGIAMVPIVYLFGKRFTKSTPAAALVCTLFAFDFMHFTQTRIATIDVYVTFFVILMYVFMYKYVCLSFYDTPLRKTLVPLGASGVCMGLGIACKWTGIYAGAGLAVIFFATLYRRTREYRYAQSDPDGSTLGISHARILKTFIPNVKKTVLFCVVFFGCIPALIYLLSYLPFKDGTNNGLLARAVENQKLMFGYHSSLDATHAYSSAFYEWPVMVRPIWYFSGIVSDTVREGISAFGNPLVWWSGIPAFLYILYLTTIKKDRYAAFLTVGYLAQYLPWFFVTRITFIYHYFPSVFFVVMMIVYSLMQCGKRLSPRRLVILMSLYGLAVLALFVLFYPVLSGQPVEAAFVDKWLRWFNGWVLTAG